MRQQKMKPKKGKSVKSKKKTPHKKPQKIIQTNSKIPQKSSNAMKKAGTGILNFDKMIQKGFERNSINLIAGGSGSGKSIFALQFLIQGIKIG